MFCHESAVAEAMADKGTKFFYVFIKEQLLIFVSLRLCGDNVARSGRSFLF